MTALIEARAVSYRAAGRTLVAEASLALHPGRFLVAIGPNGAGKSTLLRLLTGELHPCAGTVLYDGAPLPHHADRRLAAKRAVMAQIVAAHLPLRGA